MGQLEQQLYENGVRRRVYFADLDSMTEQYDGCTA